jgi:molybdopterin-guanine dinucleotide biosynthesis protein A
MSQLTEVTAIILAGGKSTRMGTDKGLVELNGKPMVQWVVEAAQQVANHTMIVSNTSAYQLLDLPVYADIFPDTGPLGGIYTGLSHSTTDANLVIACDMPFVSVKVLQWLLAQSSGYDIVVPSINGMLEPLCGFYHRQTQEKMKELIAKKTLKMQEIIRHFLYKEWVLDQAGQTTETAFINVNTPVELEKIKRLYEN